MSEGRPDAANGDETTRCLTTEPRSYFGSLAATAVSTLGSGWGDWMPVYRFELSPDDDDPRVAVAGVGGVTDLNFFARDRRGVTVDATLCTGHIAGVLASGPGVVRPRAAILGSMWAIDDHGRPGVWWRIFGRSYKPPCNYNQTRT